MALPVEHLYTIKDIYALADGERAALIDVQMYYMSPPGTTHQIVSGKLFQIIANYIDDKKGSCRVFAAPFAVFLNRDDQTYVEPDICVICDNDKLDERGCHGAPDWIIEIVSPGSKSMDYGTKLFKYQAADVREYWVVDPAKNRITVWSLEQNTVEDYTFSDSVKAGIYEDLFVDFCRIIF